MESAPRIPNCEVGTGDRSKAAPDNDDGTGTDLVNLKLVLSFWLVDFNHKAQLKLGHLLGLANGGEPSVSDAGGGSSEKAATEALPPTSNNKDGAWTLHVEAGGSGKILIEGGIDVSWTATLGAVKQQIFDVLGNANYLVRRQRLFASHDAMDDSQELGPDTDRINSIDGIAHHSTLVLVVKSRVCVKLIPNNIAIGGEATFYLDPDMTIEELAYHHRFFKTMMVHEFEILKKAGDKTVHKFVVVSANLKKTLADFNVQDGTEIINFFRTPIMRGRPFTISANTSSIRSNVHNNGLTTANAAPSGRRSTNPNVEKNYNNVFTSNASIAQPQQHTASSVNGDPEPIRARLEWVQVPANAIFESSTKEVPQSRKEMVDRQTDPSIQQALAWSPFLRSYLEIEGEAATTSTATESGTATIVSERVSTRSRSGGLQAATNTTATAQSNSCDAPIAAETTSVRRWLGQALDEHASIASFNKFSLGLMVC